MKEIDLSELEKEKERISNKISFVGQQIDKLEKTLQESAFLPYEHTHNTFGPIKWMSYENGQNTERRVCVFYRDKYKPLIECPADIRWVVYHHLQGFVDGLIENQKNRTKNENNQTETKKS